jgi:hypothetical protein
MPPVDEPRHSFAYLILDSATGGAAVYMDARHDIDELVA